ncbi:MAG: serpin family protein [Anaerolineae bacterium]|nr:serpin family protein [Anaerolineae bacterium]
MIKRLFVCLLLLAAASAVSAQTSEETTMPGNEAFTFDFYAQVKGEAGNLFFSPHSILSAFWLAYLGADGDTAAQMSEALHLPLPVDAANSPVPEFDFAEDESFILHSANALWAQQDFPWRQEFVNLLQSVGSPIQRVDYHSDPEAIRQQINDWVEAQTEDKIQDLIPEGVIDTLTRMVIANAVYFKATWVHSFSEELTQDAPFTLLDGTTEQVPMMTLSEGVRLKVYQGDDVVAVALPYQGREIEMVVLLPNEGGFEAFEDSLTAERFTEILDAMHPELTRVSMPRFSFETLLSLRPTLEALGITDAFDPAQADFSRMYDPAATDERLFISAALHKAFVDVNEVGTEAAAATGIVIGALSAAEETLNIRVDRPFLFAIRDVQTNTILFMGRVLNP